MRFRPLGLGLLVLSSTLVADDVEPVVSQVNAFEHMNLQFIRSSELYPNFYISDL